MNIISIKNSCLKNSSHCRMWSWLSWTKVHSTLSLPKLWKRVSGKCHCKEKKCNHVTGCFINGEKLILLYIHTYSYCTFLNSSPPTPQETTPASLTPLDISLHRQNGHMWNSRETTYSVFNHFLAFLIYLKLRFKSLLERKLFPIQVFSNADVILPKMFC